MKHKCRTAYRKWNLNKVLLVCSTILTVRVKIMELDAFNHSFKVATDLGLRRVFSVLVKFLRTAIISIIPVSRLLCTTYYFNNCSHIGNREQMDMAEKNNQYYDKLGAGKRTIFVKCWLGRKQERHSLVCHQILARVCVRQPRRKTTGIILSKIFCLFLRKLVFEFLFGTGQPNSDLRRKESKS